MPTARFPDVSPTVRKVMRANRGKDTEPELTVRRGLHARGLRFRLHRKDLPGRPDVVFPSAKVAVFVHGCFWHGCTRCDRGRRRPKSNPAFWDAKLVENRSRDARNESALREAGWRVEIIWECDLRAAGRVPAVLDRIEASVRRSVPDDA